jgi:hypothetical protein
MINVNYAVSAEKTDKKDGKKDGLRQDFDLKGSWHSKDWDSKPF